MGFATTLPAIFRDPKEFTEGGIFKDLFGQGGPSFEIDMPSTPGVLPDISLPSPPGYQQPPGGQQPSQQQQGYQQYYQQMRQSIDGLSQSLKELESMSTPGGQYKNDNAFDTKMFVPSNSGSVGK